MTLSLWEHVVHLAIALSRLLMAKLQVILAEMIDRLLAETMQLLMVLETLVEALSLLMLLDVLVKVRIP